MNILQIETLAGGFSEWLFNQGPVFILLILGIIAVMYLSSKDKKEAVTREEKNETKLEKVSEEKDRLFERLYNAMTDWHLIIKETAKSVDNNSDVVDKSKATIDKTLVEINQIKRDLEDIKHKLDVVSLNRNRNES